jgi:hypothetical protein
MVLKSPLLSMALVITDESLMNLLGISFGRLFFDPYQAKALRPSFFKEEVVAWVNKRPGVKKGEKN